MLSDYEPYDEAHSVRSLVAHRRQRVVWELPVRPLVAQSMTFGFAGVEHDMEDIQSGVAQAGKYLLQAGHRRGRRPDLPRRAGTHNVLMVCAGRQADRLACSESPAGVAQLAEPLDHSGRPAPGQQPARGHPGPECRPAACWEVWVFSPLHVGCHPVKAGGAVDQCFQAVGGDDGNDCRRGGQAGVPYAGELYLSVLRLTRNPADAEVLVQETPHRGPVC